MAKFQSSISAQGAITSLGGTIYTPPEGYASNVQDLKIVCPNNYTITLKIYRRVPNTLVTIYSYILEGGSVVIDDTDYFLNTGDSLWASSTGVDTVFTMVGTQSTIYN